YAISTYQLVVILPSVHPYGTKAECITLRKVTLSLKGGDDGGHQELGDRLERLVGVGDSDPSPTHDQRLLGLDQHLGGSLDRQGVDFHVRSVTSDLYTLREGYVPHFLLNVLRYVHEDRSWPPAC